MPRIIYKNADGQRLSGWTTIIGQNLGWGNRPLQIWSNNIGLQGIKLSEYTQPMDIGTMTHARVQGDLINRDYRELLREQKFDLANLTDEVISKSDNGFLAWLEWKSQVQFDLLKSEISLVSEEYKFGGTIDIVARVKGLPSIIDIKTGETYPNHLVQIRGYTTLWNENFPDQRIQSYYLLRLGKEDGSFSYHYFPNLDDYWEVAKLLLQLEALRKKLKA